MISLMKLADAGEIEKTGAKPKLPIKVEGVSSKTLDVYKIPLQYLYYNDENGRIATGISQYKGKLNPTNDLEDESYNNFMAKLIREDNGPALKETEKSFEASGQKVYGFVLDDGRIVDGNRRFTVLRDIRKKTGKTQYFEAVILPFSYSNQAERVKIKELELAIQMGVEERQSYDPVDFAVDIYQTTAGPNPIMTIADYAAVANKKVKEIEEDYNAAIYMQKFLRFIGAPENNYNIIKESKIWSLFLVMTKSLAKNFGNNQNDLEAQELKNETINSFFGVILYQMHAGVVGNSARTHMRDYNRKIVSSVQNSDFNDDISDYVEDLSDSLQESDIHTTADLMQSLTTESESVEAIGDTFTTYMRNARNSDSVEKFIRDIRRNVDYYHDLTKDGGLVGTLRYNEISEEQLRELQKYMRELNQFSGELFKTYGEEIRKSNNY